MPKFSILIGALFIALGVGGYIYSQSGDNPSWTPLIAAILGVFIVLFATLAVKQPHKLKLWMHLVLVVALLGVIGTASSFGKLAKHFGGETIDRPVAVMVQAAVAALGIVLIVGGVGSFIQARRARG